MQFLTLYQRWWNGCGGQDTLLPTHPPTHQPIIQLVTIIVLNKLP